MSINSRNKGAAFERQIANALIEDLNLTNPVKRILEQTRTKELPDLMLGNWCIECKAYGTGAEPRRRARGVHAARGRERAGLLAEPQQL